MGVQDLHGYIHCMPYGNVSFVMRLSPLHPGYVRTVCADDSVAALTSTSNVEENIVFVYVRMTPGGEFVVLPPAILESRAVFPPSCAPRPRYSSSLTLALKQPDIPGLPVQIQSP